MKALKLLFLFVSAGLLSGCGVYNFTGAGKLDGSFQVNYFQNNSELVQPGIERTFTNKLQDLIQNQTNLTLTNSNGDRVYEGEIVDYRITPMSATADQRAAENRLTIAVNVRYTNKKNEEESQEKRYSFYRDFPGSQQPNNAELASYIDEIFDRITQDIFNDTLAKW